jgi:hypothetical protein
MSMVAVAAQPLWSAAAIFFLLPNTTKDMVEMTSRNVLLFGRDAGNMEGLNLRPTSRMTSWAAGTRGQTGTFVQTRVNRRCLSWDLFAVRHFLLSLSVRGDDDGVRPRDIAHARV